MNKSKINELIGNFPNISMENSTKTSEVDRRYNCIAWAAGATKRFWWPGPNSYWPSEVPREVSLASFVAAYETLGYQTADDFSFVDGIEKIAIYLLNGKPTHASRQLDSPRWTSKLGKNIDISHELNALNGPVYGRPEIAMQRSRAT